MFEELVVSSPVRRRRKTWAYFCGTAVLWLSVLSGALAIGVLAHDARIGESEAVVQLPSPPIMLGGTVRKGGEGEGPVALPQFEARRALVGLRSQNYPPIFDPFNLGVGAPQASGLGIGPFGGPGDPSGLPGGIPSTEGTSDAPMPVEVNVPIKKEEAVKPRQPLRSVIIQGTAIRRIEPRYPSLPQKMGISGTVAVEVVISEQGDVISARALSGHMLLKKAAEDAARGWKWKPTTLNQVPVRVIGTITFNFIL